MTDILKRTTFVVSNADEAARRYEHIFGWTRYYDDILPVDRRFPPIAPDRSEARLVMLKADDPRIGMLGFLSYCDFAPPDLRHDRLGLGSSVLVVECADPELVASRADEVGGMTTVGPVRWQVPSASGKQITLRTVSLRDRDGLYFEASCRE